MTDVNTAKDLTVIANDCAAQSAAVGLSNPAPLCLKPQSRQAEQSLDESVEWLSFADPHLNRVDFPEKYHAFKRKLNDGKHRIRDAQGNPIKGNERKWQAWDLKAKRNQGRVYSTFVAAQHLDECMREYQHEPVPAAVPQRPSYAPQGTNHVLYDIIAPSEQAVWQPFNSLGDYVRTMTEKRPDDLLRIFGSIYKDAGMSAKGAGKEGESQDIYDQRHIGSRLRFSATHDITLASMPGSDAIRAVPGSEGKYRNRPEDAAHYHEHHVTTATPDPFSLCDQMLARGTGTSNK